MTDSLAKNRHGLVELSVIEDIKCSAITYGLEGEFDLYVNAIKARFGSDSIKNGHIMWVIEQLDNDIQFSDALPIPEF